MSSLPPFASGKQGIEIVGFFHSASGIGEAARLCARQLADAGYKVRCTSVERVTRKHQELEWTFDNTAAANDIGCRIFHLNPPMMPPVVLNMGLRAFGNSYNIGALAWELEEIPREWVTALRYTNACFCPSEFTSRTIKKYTNKPVITVPHPVPVGTVETGTRRRLGISDDTFLVSNVFSFGSALERKNPHAVVSSFVEAFGDALDVCLLMKTNGGGDLIEKSGLVEAIKSHRNIRLVDALWPKEQVLGLMMDSDVYLSMHRSEGFGLPIAEAMRLGTPVVVTNWSGTMDFCNEKNSYLVDYDMVPVKSEHPEFAALGNLRWADPKPDQAAALLREIHDNRNEAQRKAEICVADTNQYFTEHSYDRALQQLR